jgi:hypothetical protein
MFRLRYSAIGADPVKQRNRTNVFDPSSSRRRRFGGMDRGSALLLAGVFLLGARGLGQSAGAPRDTQRYVEYPQNQGKVQPLQWNALPAWMTLDMDLRERTENQTSLNYISGNDQLYQLTRIRGGLEIRPTKFLTGYIQFHDNHALGLQVKYLAANMRDSFDDRQAYMEFHVKPVQLYAGRFELGISDWTNNSRTWDGFLGRIGDKNRLDLFSTSVVAIHATSLDKHGAGLTFHGAVGSITTWVPHTTIQPFVYIKAFPRVLSQQAIYGTETEVTPGAEVVGNYGGFDYDAMGALQRGSYSNDSIHSGAGIVKAGYSALSVKWKPRLRGEYDYASGNAHRDLQRIGTFDQQYPSNHNAFGLTDLFGFQNIEQTRANLDLTPTKHLTLLFQQEWLNLTTVRDNIYSGSGGTIVKAPTAGFLRSGLGREFDASGKYVFRDYLVMNVGVGHFSPDGAMVQNGHGQPQTISYLSFTYRFKVNAKDTTQDPKSVNQ